MLNPSLLFLFTLPLLPHLLLLLHRLHSLFSATSAMELVSTVLVVVGFFFVCFLFRFFSRAGGRRAPAFPLPPGTMGLPYVGETFQLYSQNPNDFFAAKQESYGSIFKTHILGCPCVMVSSPEAARFVLVTKSHLFKPTFPSSKERMLGKEALFFHQGDYHSKLRKLVLRAFMPEAIKANAADIDSIATASLQSWENATFINTFQEMKTFAFNVGLRAIFGKDEKPYIEDMKRCYLTLEKGYNSMPINFPGTLFYKSMKAREELSQIFAKILSSRREAKTDRNDFLGSLMDEKAALTDQQIADNIIGVIFAARDTTASVLTWTLKYLAENPAVLDAVTAEQEAIMRSKEENGEEKSVTWADTKKMPISSRVIQETLRVASVLSFTFREAIEDVVYDGYLIPKGWKVLPLFRNIHHSPDSFPDPQKFDPSRFEVAQKPNTYMPFGNGIHSCPGNELAKLEMLVMLHHLTTKYRWTVVGAKEGIQYGPFALPKNGLPISISLRK